MIVGGGVQKTLRLVAQYGDACNLFARMGDETLRHKLDVLREHCDAVGRPYEEIEKTALMSLNIMHADGAGGAGAVTAAEAVARLADLAALGFEHVILNTSAVYDPLFFDIVGAEVIPAAEQLAVAGR
jgi:alkanesulfonate monooxygenase SsuD/methylene tetrahydromethanopterin reductase-like flavin-dependent oxidoreductase (luciferase family)